VRRVQGSVEIALELDVIEDFVDREGEIAEKEADIDPLVVLNRLRTALLRLWVAGSNGNTVEKSLQELGRVL